MAYLDIREDALLLPPMLPAGPVTPLVCAPRPMPKRIRPARQSAVQGVIMGIGAALLAMTLFFIAFRVIGEVWPAIVVVALALLPFAPLAAGPGAGRQGSR